MHINGTVWNIDDRTHLPRHRCTTRGHNLLHTLLSRHPEIVMPTEGTDSWDKEQHFFSRKVLRESLAAYESRLCDDGKPDAHIYGEITPAYAALPYPVVRGVSQYLPPDSTKIFLVVRNPLDRVSSSVKMYFKQRYGEAEVWDKSLWALILVAERPGCVARTNYMRTLVNWSAVYGEGNVKILEFDQLTSNPAEILRQLLIFLGALDDVWFDRHIVPRGKVHPSSPVEIPPRFRRYLVWRWYSMTYRLEQRLGGRAVPWAASIRDEWEKIGWYERVVFALVFGVAWLAHIRKRLELCRRHRRLVQRMRAIFPGRERTPAPIATDKHAR